MNVLLIYPTPDVPRKPRFGFSYEFLQLATVLETQASVFIRDYSCENYDETELKNFCANEPIDLVFIECDSFALKRSQNIVHARQIIGLLSSVTIIVAYGNYCYITGESFANATHTVFENDINGLIDIYNVYSGKPIGRLEAYDDFPYINRSLLYNIPYYKRFSACTLMQTAKGCENTCIFCQRKGWQRKYVVHSDDYVLGEMRRIREQGFKDVWIIDENFTFNLVRAKRILAKIIQEGYAKGLNLFISSWANIDEEFIRLAAQCNIRIISFGIESGNQEILNYYRKNIQISDIPDRIRYANDCGIFTVGNFIIGAPMETEETIEQTFSLIQACEFDQINIKILDYMIGSELYESLPAAKKTSDSVFSCQENGLTQFYLSELKSMKDNFLHRYYTDHKEKIERKIKKFGKPYDTVF